MSNKVTSKVNRSLQQQIDDLTRLINWFDQEDFDIEEAIAKYHEAEKAAAAIRKDMLELKNEIDVLKARFEEAS